MRIVLITPAIAAKRSGNQTTAERWARILRALGHRVRVAHDHDGAQADMMIALHAWRSAASIQRFRVACPDRPLVVALTGTDINEYLASDRAPTLRSIEAADALVGLHDLVARRLPRRFRDKLRVIHQSARAIRRAPGRRDFIVVVVGHLREVKDPLRAAFAARLLPEASRVRVVHVGAAHTPEWAARARAEMAGNPRYLWRGEVAPASVRRLLSRARALVLSSLNEGGANVISEAVMAGLPVLASRIDGSVGLLGRDYPGYFPVGDERALARLLRRIEEDRDFARRLETGIARRRGLFTLAREHAAWKRLIEDMTRVRRG